MITKKLLLLSIAPQSIPLQPFSISVQRFQFLPHTAQKFIGNLTCLFSLFSLQYIRLEYVKKKSSYTGVQTYLHTYGSKSVKSDLHSCCCFKYKPKCVIAQHFFYVSEFKNVFIPQLTEKKRVHSCDNLASQSPINTKRRVKKQQQHSKYLKNYYRKKSKIHKRNLSFSAPFDLAMYRVPL